MYYNKNMTRVLFFTIYILFFALLSSLLFTILYMQFDEQPILALNKAIKYGALLLCGIFIIPTLKFLKINNRQLLGYAEPKLLFLFQIVKGFLLSILLLIPLIFLYNYLEIRIINDINLIAFNTSFLQVLIYTIFISFVISTVEESYFRGIMIRGGSNIVEALLIIIFSSLIYSLFHFIKIPLIIDENIFWYTGLIELSNVFANFFKIISLDSAITLFVFGILLGIVRVRHQSISYCIGIHAGFIFLIKTFKQNSSVNYNSTYNSFLSSHDQFTGNLATIWIILILITYSIYISKYKK